MFNSLDILNAEIQAQIDERKNNPRPPSGFFSPSQFVYFECPMQFFLFKMIGGLWNPDIELQIKVDTGTGMHELIQGRYTHAKELGLVKDVQHEVWLPKNPWLIRGKMDTHIVDLNGMDHLIEIKTRDPEKFQWLKKPLKGYVKQVGLYGFMTGIKSLQVLIFNNVDDFKCYPVPFERSEFISFVLKSINETLACIKMQKLPAKKCLTYKESCTKYCNYTEVCPSIKTFDNFVADFKPGPRGFFTTDEEYYVIKQAENKAKAEAKEIDGDIPF